MTDEKDKELRKYLGYTKALMDAIWGGVGWGR